MLPESLHAHVLRLLFETEGTSVLHAVPRLLHLALSSLTGAVVQQGHKIPLILSACVRGPHGWTAFSTAGHDYAGQNRAAEDFGCEPGWSCVGRELLTFPGHEESGWISAFAEDVHGWQNQVQTELPAWRKVLQQMLLRYCFEELHHCYSAIVNASVDAIITVNERGLIVSFNPGAARMFGYTPEEVLGQSVNVLMPPPYASEHDSYLEKYLETGVKRIIGIGRRVPARRRDGSIFPAHLAVTEYERHGQRFFIGTMRDLSDFIEARSRAVVEERLHLSRELHDSVSQALFGIVLGAQAIKNSAHNPQQTEEAAEYVLHLAESGLAEMRTLIFELRPESLESEGLLASLRKQIEALARRYKLEIHLEGNEEPQLDTATKHETYRIIMESLHNVVKHAQASECQVILRQFPGEYQLLVKDNGRGFDPRQVPPDRMGLSSMRERILQLGGRMDISSVPGEGTQVAAWFPAREG